MSDIETARRIAYSKERYVGGGRDSLRERVALAIAEGMGLVRRETADYIGELEAIVGRLVSDDVRGRRGIIPDAKRVLTGSPHSEKNSAS